MQTMLWNKRVLAHPWPMYIYFFATQQHTFLHEDDSLLGCCAVWSCRSRPTFQRCVLPPSSGPWVRNTRRSGWQNRSNPGQWGGGGVLRSGRTERRSHRPADGGSTHLWNVVKFYETTRCNIPEGYLHTRRRESQKSEKWSPEMA
jgi:hypothetical protein